MQAEPNGKRNKRSVWTVPTAPYSGAHFAVFPPKLIEPRILAGCPPAGKRCDCDTIIRTPTGEGFSDDPTMLTGRKGMNRVRKQNEGVRLITRSEQRGYAQQMQQSAHRAEMRDACGSAFEHYIRTDTSGARPLPEELLQVFLGAGWLTAPPPCEHLIEPAGVVLDPFCGAGTTSLVASRHGRSSVGIEINPAYAAMARNRIKDDAPLFNMVK